MSVKKCLLLLIIASLLCCTYSCGGGGGSGSGYKPPGTDTGIPSTVRMYPTRYITQTNGFISLYVEVRDGNGVPLKDVPVTFTNLSEPFGVISTIKKMLKIQKTVGALSVTTAKTNGYGMAIVKLSSTTPGFATIQSEVNTGTGKIRDKKTFYFSLYDMTPPSPEDQTPTLDLHVCSANNTTCDELTDDLTLFKTTGDNQRTLKAVVRDTKGNLVAGTTVTFGSDSPNETTFFPQTTTLTNMSGEASVVVQIDPRIVTSLSRVLNVTAYDSSTGSSAYGAADIVSLFLQPVNVSNVTVTASPSVVAPNGTSTINAVVYTSTGGTAPDGTTVTFSAVCGSNAIFITPFAQLTNGLATIEFTAPSTPGTCTVTATAGGMTGTANITVTLSTLTIIPATQTITDPKATPTPSSATYTIIGGVGPYSAFSDRPDLVNVPASFTGPSFNVTVKSVPSTDTTVGITIYDSLGTQANVSLVLDVIPPLPLSVTPQSITITGFANPDSKPSDDVTFYITGGTTPYSMFSSNDAVIASQGALAQNTFTIDPQSVSTQTSVTLTVEDKTGATSTVIVTVTPPSTSLGLNPGSITVNVGTNVIFSILGGSPNYTAFTSDVSKATVNGGSSASLGALTTFTVNALNAGQSTITVQDSTGKTATATITINAPAIKVLPSAQTINGAPGGTATFKIFNGVAPYSVFTNNPLFPPTPDSGIASGGQFTVTVPPNTSATSAAYTIRDSVGTEAVATLSISFDATDYYLLPAAATIPVGLSMTFAIYGGVEQVSGGFDLFIDNPVVDLFYDVGIAPRYFTVVGGSAGSVTITVRDKNNRQITTVVTVTP